MSDLNREMNVNFDDKTRTFSVNYGEKETVKEILKFVYDSLMEKGYNPVNQIAGYVLSEDPTYITTYNGARTLIQKIDRYELLKMTKNFLIYKISVSLIISLPFWFITFKKYGGHKGTRTLDLSRVRRTL